MSWHFHIAPFSGAITEFAEYDEADSLHIINYERLFAAVERSTLRIDPDQYRQALLETWKPKWPRMEIGGPGPHPLLGWELFYDPEKISGGHASLAADHKTITMNTIHPAFIIWHRKLIPVEYKLLIWMENSSRTIELSANFTADDLYEWFDVSPDRRL